MATQIHGAGPTGQRSPGLDLAIAGYLAENGVAGGSGGTVAATDAPTAPAEGASASYLVTSAVVWPAGLVWSTDPDGGTEPTITTTALVSLFTVGGTTYAVMGSTYPVSVVPDTTDPIPGSLAVVTTSTTADLTVTGASDEVALHATPYAYSSDNGSTWTAYQAGATYQFTGLTASTSYTFQHRVKDAAGNVATGTAVTESTAAPSSDTTPPTAGTLAASSITDTGFTLTVTGASDETALDATPYAFSTDNGATYSAWQASNVYAASGLTASTAYDCVHKVKDAAANEATGTAITVNTTGSSPTILAADDFNRADSSTLGNTSTGDLPWVEGFGDMQIVSNTVRAVYANGTRHVAYFDTATSDNISIAVDFTPGNTYWDASVIVRAVDGSNYVDFAIQNASGNQALRWRKRVAGTNTNVETSAPTTALVQGVTYPVEITVSGSTLTATVHGSTVTTTSITDFQTATKQGVSFYTSAGQELGGSSFDNIVVATL